MKLTPLKEELWEQPLPSMSSSLYDNTYDNIWKPIWFLTYLVINVDADLRKEQ